MFRRKQSILLQLAICFVLTASQQHCDINAQATKGHPSDRSNQRPRQFMTQDSIPAFFPKIQGMGKDPYLVGASLGIMNMPDTTPPQPNTNAQGTCTSSNPAKDFIFIVGTSQSGKSSLINTMLGKPLCLVGDGALQSTTGEDHIKDAIQIPGVNLILQDTIGTEDTRGRYANEQIKELQDLQMQREKSQECKFIVTQSLSFPQVISRTIAELEGQYGPRVRESVVGVLTKGNLVPEGQQKRRIQAAMEECREIGIECIIVKTDWAEQNLTAKERKEQNKRIVEALGMVKPYSAKFRQDRLSQIQKEALLRQKNGPIKDGNCRNVTTNKRADPEQVGEAALIMGMILGLMGGPAGAVAGAVLGAAATIDKGQTIMREVCDKVPALPIEHYLQMVQAEYIKKAKADIFKAIY